MHTDADTLSYAGKSDCYSKRNTYGDAHGDSYSDNHTDADRYSYSQSNTAAPSDVLATAESTVIKAMMVVK